MIEVSEVTKSFDGLNALDCVNAKISEGSIYGLIGSNGSGKSTLLRVLCGVYKPEHGSVLIDGENVWENTEAKAKLFYISDDQFFVPNTTIRKTADFLKSVYPTFDEERYQKLLSIFKLDDKRRISTFSKGMKKQACIILGMACRPKYLLCDETFDGLDPVMRQLTKKLFAESVADGSMTPIIASHNLRELEDICDHVGLLHKGGIMFEKDVDDLKLGSYKVQCIFEKELDINSFKELNIISFSKRGSLYTLIAKGKKEEIEEKLTAMLPKFIEVLPMTLEEIFTCEMEEHGYEFTESLI